MSSNFPPEHSPQHRPGFSLRELTLEHEGSSEPPEILIVDDEQISCEVLAQVLSGYGCRTRISLSGESALRMLDEAPTDLVILDVSMPGMDGFEVLRRIREDYAEVELPVIMATADTSRESILQAYRQGANDYVEKPLDPGLTVARIRTHLKLQRTLRALRESEERYSLAALGTNDGLWDWDLNADRVYYSPRWRQMLGVPEDTEAESPEFWLNRIHPDDRGRVETELQRHLSGESSHFETEVRIRHETDGFRWMLCRGIAVRDDGFRAYRIAGSLTDVTQGKVADALTGFPNRLLFTERLKSCFERFSQGTDAGCAVLYMDLDDFKLVNDSLGHEAGDRLLVEVAARINSVVAGSDAIAFRMGGDEFTILSQQTDDTDAAIELAERILASLSEPVVLSEQAQVYPTASIGVSLMSNRCRTPADLLQEADTAMYRAKMAATGKPCLYDPGMHQEVVRRFQIESDIKNAVALDQFELHYQPVLDCRSGMVAGVEALIRWRHPDRGLLLPGEFLGIVEQSPLIHSLGIWVLEQACRQQVQWHRTIPGLRGLWVSVNVSRKQFSLADFAERTLEIVGDSGCNPELLRLEVTESTVMDDPRVAVQQLQIVRNAGIRVGIDDFGTGYSSLATLDRLPLDFLKIDKSFVMEMHDTPTRAAITRTIIDLGHGLGLEVIGEGVETDAQLRQLQNDNCRYVQGFRIAAPMPVDDCTQFISQFSLPVPASRRAPAAQGF